MKKILLILTIGILITSCVENKSEVKDEKSIDSKTDHKSNKVELEYVNRRNQIELAHTDDKYGEWGGDTYIILVYSDDTKYYANYAKYLGSYKPPEPPSEKKVKKKWYEYKELENKIDSIELNSENLQLIKDVIIYLANEKITNRSVPYNAGIFNSVVSRDSTLVINSYPSDNWEPFQKLKTKLIQE